MEASITEVMVCLTGAFLVGKFLSYEAEPEFNNYEEYDDDDGCKQ
jgi:hypothetical protein